MKGDEAAFDYTSGVTIRDYFAAAALTGLLASEPMTDDRVLLSVGRAYVIADALIKIRNEKNDTA